MHSSRLPYKIMYSLLLPYILLHRHRLYIIVVFIVFKCFFVALMQTLGWFLQWVWYIRALQASCRSVFFQHCCHLRLGLSMKITCLDIISYRITGWHHICQHICPRHNNRRIKKLQSHIFCAYFLLNA